MNTPDKNWTRSSWHGEWDWNINKIVITHKTPLRCPFCGDYMNFNDPVFYESSSRDWYWSCPTCGMEMGNIRDLSISEARKLAKKYKEEIEGRMKECESKLMKFKERYEAYGKYYTSKEKRNILIEKIQLPEKQSRQ